MDQDQNKKAIVYQASVKAFREGEGTWQNKLSGLIAHFDAPMLQNSAKIATKAFRNWTNPNLYLWRFIKFLGEDLATITLTGTTVSDPAIPIPYDRKRIKYCMYVLTVNREAL